MLFYLKYSILDHARSECLTLFGGMSATDDANDAAGVTILGRWSTVGESKGYCVCRAPDNKTLNAWLINWAPMATIEAYPIVDDNQARAILKSEVEYTFDYANVGREPADGESLFIIEFAFFKDKRKIGYDTFASLTRDMDVQDAGKNTCLGRWHRLGDGSGVVLCASTSEADLYAWAHNWSELCSCVIRPVVTDAQFRANVRGKPDFAEKHAALVEKMTTPRPKKSWWRN